MQLSYNSSMEMIDINFTELIDHLQGWMFESKRPDALKAYIVALLIRARLGDIVLGEVPLDIELIDKKSLGLMMKSTYKAFNNAPIIAESQLGNTFSDRFLKKSIQYMKNEIDYLSKSIYRNSNALMVGGGDSIWGEAQEIINN